LALKATASLVNTPAIAVGNGTAGLNASFDVSAAGYTPPAAQTITGSAGTIYGTVTLNSSSGVVNPGTASSRGVGTTGTLTFANTLSINGGTIGFSLLDPSPAGHDQITVNTLDLAGTANLVVAPISPGMSSGVYDLISYSTLTGGGLGNLNLVKAARFQGGLDTSTPGLVKLNVISAGSASLRWAGTGSGSVNWDANNTVAWINTATNQPDVFFNTDAVSFEDTPGVTGSVNITMPVQPASINVTTGSNVPTYNFGGAGAIGGQTGLVKHGSGTLIISTANSFTGGTTVNQGTLVLANSTAAGTGSILLNSSGAALMMSGSGITISNTINIASDDVVIGGNGTINAAVNTLASNIRVSLPTTGTTLSLRETSVFTNLSAGPIRLTVSDSSTGSIRFTNTNSSFGAIDWDLGNSSATMFNRDGPRAIPLGSLAGGPNTALRGSSNAAGVTTFTIGGGAQLSTVFAGSILDGTAASNGGTLALIKSAGTLTLSGNNTYSGTTQVQAGGALFVNGTHVGGGAYTVSGTLGGSGFITAGVTAAAGSTLAPGASVGVLSVASLSIDSTTLNFEFDSSGGDGIVISNDTFSVAGSNTINISDLGGALAGTYPLIDYGGAPLANLGAFSLNGSVGGFTASLVNNTAGTSIDLSLVGGSGPVHAMWAVDADGVWGNNSNWSPAAPDGQDYQAYFGSIASSPRSVNVDSPRTVAKMHFNSSAGYTIGGNTITLSSSSGNAVLNVLRGSHTIAAPLSLSNDTTAQVTAPEAVLTVSGNISGSRAITKTGLGKLVLAGTNTYSGVTTVSSGTLEIGGGTTSGSVASAIVNNANLSFNRSDAHTISAAISGSGRVYHNGTGTTTLSGALSYTGGTVVNAGVLAAPKFTAANGTLTINNGMAQATLKPTPNSPAGTSRLSALSISATGRLDLTNNSLILNNGSLATATAQVKTALENGGAFDWGGPGIGSSEAAARNTTAGSFLYGLGVIKNDLAQVGGSGPIYTDFAGESGLTAAEVLVKFTYFGDADLSGSIDATDYSLIDNGYVNSLSGWLNGDFDYSGSIDATDYALIDNAYVNQAGPLAEALIAQHSQQFGGEYVAALQAVQSGVIPEPMGMGLWLGAAWLLRRLRTGYQADLQIRPWNRSV
ncbi:MAG TPA: autotransporter-associated beta strand repeat-containing protein, partial [Tepidisphaeraceae bacterium]|nr:autotransporter-associated beta strand repeat-containing protein [Tepidisphaeraceae bacterium]